MTGSACVRALSLSFRDSGLNQYENAEQVSIVQFQTHYLQQSVYLCHTSCELLNAGLLETYLATVTEWLQQNPNEVVTILMGNYDRISPMNYTVPILDSGLIDFVYKPPNTPMTRADWPTLSDLIHTNKRAIVFLDYEANQAEVQYILDEFSQLWETPFSPTDRHFPCSIQRPPGLSAADAKNRMYIANHNLNMDISLAGVDILIPDNLLLEVTNADSGYGSLGSMAENCTS